MQVSENAVHVLHHTLGLSPCRREPYRNHFVAYPGHHDMPALEELERAGLMSRVQTPRFCDPSDIVFCATDGGRDFAVGHLPPEPKRTRYDEYLDAEYPDGFAEFLGIRKPEFEQRGSWGNIEYRMYRITWDHWRDVEGEWASTKKDAKASYKAALKAKARRNKEA